MALETLRDSLHASVPMEVPNTQDQANSDIGMAWSDSLFICSL